jgi:hypothetical protein
MKQKTVVNKNRSFHAKCMHEIRLQSPTASLVAVTLPSLHYRQGDGGSRFMTLDLERFAPMNHG